MIISISHPIKAKWFDISRRANFTTKTNLHCRWMTAAVSISLRKHLKIQPQTSCCGIPFNSILLLFLSLIIIINEWHSIARQTFNWNKFHVRQVVFCVLVRQKSLLIFQQLTSVQKRGIEKETTKIAAPTQSFMKLLSKEWHFHAVKVPQIYKPAHLKNSPQNVNN